LESLRIPNGDYAKLPKVLKVTAELVKVVFESLRTITPAEVSARTPFGIALVAYARTSMCNVRKFVLHSLTLIL